MSKYIYLLLFFNFTFSQYKGQIYYDIEIKKKNIEKKDTIQSEEKSHLASFFKSILKNSIERKIVLTFDKNISLQEDRNELNNVDDPYNIINEDKLYINNKELIYLNQKDLYGKRFLIRDSLEKNDWKILENDFKLINGYKCVKAILINDTNKTKESFVNAWYAVDILSGCGPDFYYGLPGLILEIETENIYYKCKKIEIDNNVKIKELKKGEKVTKEEFDLIYYKKQNEILNFKDNKL